MWKRNRCWLKLWCWCYLWNECACETTEDNVRVTWPGEEDLHNSLLHFTFSIANSKTASQLRNTLIVFVQINQYSTKRNVYKSAFWLMCLVWCFIVSKTKQSTVNVQTKSVVCMCMVLNRKKSENNENMCQTSNMWCLGNTSEIIKGIRLTTIIITRKWMWHSEKKATIITKSTWKGCWYTWSRRICYWSCTAFQCYQSNHSPPSYPPYQQWNNQWPAVHNRYI